MSRKAIGFLAALLTLGFIVAGVFALEYHPQWVQDILSVAFASVLLFGVVTVTYEYPVSGSSAPTAQKMLTLSLVTAVLNWGDTDTTATITHNMGITAAQLAQLFPFVSVYAVALNGSPSAPPPFVSTLATNSITITKSSVTNSGGTFNVYIFRPNTVMT